MIGAFVILCILIAYGGWLQGFKKDDPAPVPARHARPR